MCHRCDLFGVLCMKCGGTLMYFVFVFNYGCNGHRVDAGGGLLVVATIS